VAETLSAWLVKHGYEQSLIMAPANAVNRTLFSSPGNSALGSSISSMSGFGSDTSHNSRTSPPPDKQIDIGDTVSETAQDTLKGLRNETSPVIVPAFVDSSTRSKSGSSIKRAKSLPKARSIELDPENVLDSSPLISVASHKNTGTRTSSKNQKNNPLFLWMVIAGVVLGVLLIIALLVSSMSGTNNPSKPKQPSVIDTSHSEPKLHDLIKRTMIA
jgi:hypothetical protein